ncbi:uncharacterized protein C7orf50 homolog isoform X2 [Petaurus breviceps papuanus]|uniref:uncharacterized protein C7orf50 homolog isoform X2 n=1 Tax=Petaurus breviceps papuanus TaxID=3040969 RepID=UPI0036D976C9
MTSNTHTSSRHKEEGEGAGLNDFLLDLPLAIGYRVNGPRSRPMGREQPPRGRDLRGVGRTVLCSGSSPRQRLQVPESERPTCRMAEQKKKRSEVSEKKKRKLKKLVTGEEPLAQEKPLKKKKKKISKDPLDTEISQVATVSDEEKEGEQELTPEEKRALERKLKKERKKEERKQLREAGIHVVKENPQKPSGAELALDYLISWANKRKEWKFQKTRQTWLLLHMYDSNKVPDKHFSILLDYLEGLKGRAREVTVQKAETLMKKLDNAEPEDSSLLEKSERIRQVLQLLS